MEGHQDLTRMNMDLDNLTNHLKNRKNILHDISTNKTILNRSASNFLQSMKQSQSQSQSLPKSENLNRYCTVSMCYVYHETKNNTKIRKVQHLCFDCESPLESITPVESTKSSEGVISLYSIISLATTLCGKESKENQLEHLKILELASEKLAENKKTPSDKELADPHDNLTLLATGAAFLKILKIPHKDGCTVFYGLLGNYVRQHPWCSMQVVAMANSTCQRKRRCVCIYPDGVDDPQKALYITYTEHHKNVVTEDVLVFEGTPENWLQQKQNGQTHKIPTSTSFQQENLHHNMKMSQMLSRVYQHLPQDTKKSSTSVNVTDLGLFKWAPNYIFLVCVVNYPHYKNDTVSDETVTVSCCWSFPHQKTQKEKHEATTTSNHTETSKKADWEIIPLGFDNIKASQTDDQDQLVTQQVHQHAGRPLHTIRVALGDKISDIKYGLDCLSSIKSLNDNGTDTMLSLQGQIHAGVKQHDIDNIAKKINATALLEGLKIESGCKKLTSSDFVPIRNMFQKTLW